MVNGQARKQRADPYKFKVNVPNNYTWLDAFWQGKNADFTI
jgi:hypothetical protein